MDWGELIKNAWFWVVTTIGGGSVIGLIVMACITVARGKIAKFISQINVKEIYEKVHAEAFADIQNSVKELTFKHSIQPVLESGLEKINEKADERVLKYVSKLERKLDLLHEENKALARYFDNSIGVSDEAKDNLKKAVENYDNQKSIIEPEIEEEVKIEEIVIEQQKPEKNTQEIEKKTKIER